MEKIKEMLLMDPCYEQHIVSIKEMYEEYLFSILVPAMYEGFQSVYVKAGKYEEKYIKASKRNPDIENPGILALFQTIIQDIPNLNTHKIKIETDRIKSSTKSADVFDDLVKAVCKANIILLTYNIDNKRKVLLQTKYHENIIIHDFIHSCYIQCSKSFYIQPELFYHLQDPIIINNNKRTCYTIIRNGIKTAIKLMLPMKDILLDYITHKYEQKDRIIRNPITGQNIGSLAHGVTPGIIPGIIPGIMPGVMPGVMPGTIPGSVQGTHPDAANGLVQFTRAPENGSSGIIDEFMDVNQMIENNATGGDSVLEDNYDPTAQVFNSDDNGFGQATEEAIKNKNYSLLLSENTSPAVQTQTGTIAASLKDPNINQNINPISNQIKNNNQSKNNLSTDGSIDGSVDGSVVDGSDKSIGNENKPKEQIGGSDKTDLSATNYGLKTINITGNINKKTKQYFDETMPEINKRVEEYKSTKKQEKKKIHKSHPEISKTTVDELNTKTLVDNILKT